MANKFIGLSGGVARRTSYNWSDSVGFSFTDEYIGPRPALQEIFDGAGACGFTDATFEEYSEGDAIWILKLTYLGHPNQQDQLVRLQVEELDTKWLVQSRIANSPLWRHPKYEPLLHCKVAFGRRRWELRLDVNVEDASATIEWRPAVDNVDNVPSFTSSERYPYSGVLQQAIDGWRSARNSQLTEIFSEIILNRPEAAVSIIQRSLDSEANVVDLTKEFNVREHLVSRAPVRYTDGGDVILPDPNVPNQQYLYSVVPVSSTNPETGLPNINPETKKPFTENELADLAQKFANELLARRETYEWDRGTIVNDRVIGSRGGLGVFYGGIRQAWTTAQIRWLIQFQLNQRRNALRNSPTRCRDLDGVLLDIKTGLGNAFPSSLWIRKIPEMRQSGRGKIEVRDEWDEKLPWEIDPEIYPRFGGPSDTT